MIRGAASKVMWIGRATVLPVVLAVMLVLVFGATPASAHGGYKGVLHLGHSKAVAKVTTLVGKVAKGPAFVVKNPSGGSALGLQVSPDKAPLTVNSNARVDNLNADKLDGKHSTEFLGRTQKAADSDKLDGKDSSEFQQVPTTTQHFTIAGSAIVDQDGLNRNNSFLSGNGGTQWCTKTGGDRGYATIHLPQGAVMTAVNANYGDDAASTESNGLFFVTRMALVGSNGSYNDVFDTSLPNTAAAGALASASDTTPSSAEAATIDNTKYVYTVIAIPSAPSSAGMAICGVDISYTVAPGFSAASQPTDAPRDEGPSSMP